jgi:hypothetical protein
MSTKQIKIAALLTLACFLQTACSEPMRVTAIRSWYVGKFDEKTTNHEVDITDGNFDEYIKLRKENYENYFKFPEKYGHGITTDLTYILQDKKRKNWGGGQSYIITGMGSEYEKCRFAEQWFEKNKKTIIEIAKQGTNQNILFQSSELYEKLEEDQNGLEIFTLRYEFLDTRKHNEGIRIENTGCFPESPSSRYLVR